MFQPNQDLDVPSLLQDSYSYIEKCESIENSLSSFIKNFSVFFYYLEIVFKEEQLSLSNRLHKKYQQQLNRSNIFSFFNIAVCAIVDQN